MYGNNYTPDTRGAMEMVRREFDQKLNQVAGGVRKQMQDTLRKYEERLSQNLAHLATIAQALSQQQAGGVGGHPGTVRIENIPGRRVPFDMLVDIPIGEDTTTVCEQSFTVSQDGPFVAVKRVMAFQSAHEFSVTDATTGDVSRFVGRSYGRYRPIHSASDFNDSQHNAGADSSYWFWQWVNALAAGAAIPPAVLALPSSASSFRTMEFDGRVTILNDGSSYPRERISVPTTMWTTDIVSPQELGCLDFFERGETVTLSVQPLHVHNPSAGNVSDTNVFSAANTAGFPFLAGQYDPHEGIATPGAMTDGDPINTLATDVVSRLPSGIVTIGYIGYRIRQGPGVAD